MLGGLLSPGGCVVPVEPVGASSPRGPGLGLVAALGSGSGLSACPRPEEKEEVHLPVPRLGLRPTARPQPVMGLIPGTALPPQCPQWLPSSELPTPVPGFKAIGPNPEWAPRADAQVCVFREALDWGLWCPAVSASEGSGRPPPEAPVSLTAPRSLPRWGRVRGCGWASTRLLPGDMRCSCHVVAVTGTPARAPS